MEHTARTPATDSPASTHPSNNSRDNINGSGRRLLRWLLPLVVVGAGALVAQLLLGSGPQARIAPPPKQARVVTTASFAPATNTPAVEAMGTVIAAHESVLYPQVSGPVLAISDQLIPGGLFQAGEELLRIDEADYRLALRKQEAAVATAQAALQEERGQQAVAQREYELLDRKLTAADRALVLRQPQLASARASLDSAEAGRDQARLDLQRTRILAPFVGIVTERNVNLGTRVSTTTALLTLVNTEAFWIEVSVPVADLAWIDVPSAGDARGATVEVTQSAWPTDRSRTGRVLRLIPELDSDSRMARLLVEVPDPLALKPENTGLPPMMVNDYLRVRIVGRPLDHVVTLERRLLRDGDQVWIMAPDDTLEIRPVEVAFRGSDTVFIKSGIDRRDRVITADMSTPVAGTPLRERGDATPVPDEGYVQHGPSRPTKGAGS